MTDEQIFTLRCIGDLLEEIYGKTSTCVTTRSPSDDKIIADSIEECRDISRGAMRIARELLKEIKATK